MTDLTYRTIIGLGKTWFKAMDFQWKFTGHENIPTGGTMEAIS